MNKILLDALDSFFIHDSDANFGNVRYNSENDKTNMATVQMVDGTIKSMNVIALVSDNGRLFRWSWATNIEPNLFMKSKTLLNYAINMNSKTLGNAYIRRLLTTSEFQTSDDPNIMSIQLVLLFSLSFTWLKCSAFHMMKTKEPGQHVYIGLNDI